MLKVLTVVALLAVAQILPSCGGPGQSGGGPAVSSQPDVIGWVSEKRSRVWEATPYMIVINALEHGVTYEFYMDVGVGDLVKYERGVWTIVRRARR